MILTHESGAQEDQFDGKKWRPKISWYYPFNGGNVILCKESVGRTVDYLLMIVELQ
jgi:hypothetical protein